MDRKCNYMAFTPEEVEKGLVNDLINFLLKYNSISDDHYNEIHMTSDSYCTIVEWENVPYSHEYGGKFEYVDEDEEVVKDVEFPDGHYEYVPLGNEQEIFDEWVKEHPEYQQNEWGHWINKDEEISLSELNTCVPD